MQSALLSFHDELHSIRALLDGQDLRDAMVAAQEPQDAQAKAHWAHLRMFRALRRYDYTSAIVSLYGAFEEYVEGLIGAVVAISQRSVTAYRHLHASITKYHIAGTINLIGALHLPKYAALAVEDVVSNLHSCLSGATAFHVNVEAFKAHAANIKPSTVSELFARVGVNDLLRSIRNDRHFRPYLEQRIGTQDIDGKNDNVVFDVLFQLADRRNEVAHAKAQNLLGRGIIRDYIDYLEQFSAALNRVVEARVRDHIRTYLADQVATPIGTPFHVFQQGTVPCFELHGPTVSVGDILLCKPGGSAGVRHGAILRIEHNKAPVQTIDTSGILSKLALRVDFVVTDSSECSIMTSADFKARGGGQ